MLGKYSLLVDETDVIKAEKAIDNAIKQFAKNIKSISKRYPKVGIGDTDTDECIANEVYNAIH